MTKYERVLDALLKGEEGSMKVFGQSMKPIIESGTVLTFRSFPEYEVDDIVYCKVKGRIIDAHKVIKIRGEKDKKEYLIGNNHGYLNGWTHTIYGKVIKIGG